nr:hypothetical protein [Tanacetum cinerariifolium]
GVLEDFFVGHSGQEAAGRQHGADQQTQCERMATCGLNHDGCLYGLLLFSSFRDISPIKAIVGGEARHNNCPQCGGL